MCGIFGAILKQNDAASYLVSGLASLAYRGYDSAGICLQHNGLYVKKTLGDIQSITTPLPNASCGIGHSRWATHGKASLSNAHPHISSQHVAIVHNGIIENHAALRRSLKEKGYVFSSDTDSEVIAHLLDDLLKNQQPLEALLSISKLLVGRYAFLVMLKDYPNTLFSLSHSLPLIAGITDNGMLIASDLPALQQCSSFTKLPDQQPIKISLEGIYPEQIFEKMPLLPQRPSYQLNGDVTYQEILEQSSLVQRIATAYEDFTIPEAKQVMLIACGSSYHCALIMKHWVLSMGIYALVEVASELKDMPLPDLSQTLVITISQSGETADTLVSLKKVLKRKHLHSVAITNTTTSSLAGLCETVIPIHAGIEIGVASTKAVTAQLLALYSILVKLKEEPLEIPDSLPISINAALATNNIPSIAKNLIAFPKIICLGRSIMLPVAQELALKLKELTYLHAEAIPLGELKHGPLALVDSDTLCVVIDNTTSHAVQTAISEITARDGQVLTIGSSAPNETMHIPCQNLDHALNIIPINIICQLLSYHAAKALGRSIDKPRNLAKSVTVE